MYAYPSQSEFFQALPTLLAILRGQVAGAADLHALWVCGGYALGNLAPDPTEAAIIYTDSRHLADNLAQHAAGGGVSAVNWGALLQAILGLIATILASHK